MCGICGVVALRGALDPALAASIPAMTDALQHRGPDAGAVWSNPAAALGHRRLSIIDRAGGAQPMANEDGTRWIVFNGEIYNHRGLRQRLVDRGHRFRTTSDTETILHGYEEYGAGVLDHLEGMFAFAVYDTEAREVFLARDRIGKKPLFWGVFGGALHFASEMKALSRSPAWDDAVDADALEEYLSLGYVLAPRTIYRRVAKLEPGHWLHLKDGACVTRQYWDVTAFDEPPPPDPAAAVERLLEQAVRDRLESEVPLGAFLSGGIDSGLVVSCMTDSLGAEVSTTSVGFAAAAHNELQAAAMTANHCHTKHHAEVIEPRLDDILDRIVGAFDEPFADASAIPTYYVSQMARRHVTVALSGDGGDETFGGYSFRYVPHAVEGYARTLAGPVGRSLCGWAGRHWPRDRRLPRAFRLGTLLENVARDPASAYYFDLCFMKPGDTSALTGRSPALDPSATRVYDAVTAPYRRCPSTSVLQRAMYADLKVYLPNDVLVKVDRMSMQHGLEVRCPLLDHRLVELAFRLPAHVKMPRLQPKRILRQIAERRLPAELLRLPKHGFSAPVGEWIAGTHAEMFREDVLGATSSGGVFDRTRIVGMLDEQRRGARDHSYALWAVWMFERWRRSARVSGSAEQGQRLAGVGRA
jgi:asparagine synthase (glutamine-hydrolysing)